MAVREAYQNQVKVGMGYALIAYSSWGVFPLYWKLLKGTPHSEVLAHRIVWSALFLVLLLILKEKNQVLARLILAGKHLNYLLLSASFITVNWFTYIYAVNSDRVLEASLGYFIAPLVNVLLGTLVLKEKLRPLQKVSVAMATVGVLQLSFQVGRIPYLALLLACTFGIYGLIRKKVPLDPLIASTLESIIQIVPAIFIFAYSSHEAIAPEGLPTPAPILLLMLGGIVTALPLLWFANAVKRLPLSTIGFFQYLAPTIQFILAVFLFSEPFTSAHASSFACIWIALALYSMDLWRSTRA